MAKVALITGSAVRLGHEIAQHLAKSGWDIALHFRTSTKDVTDFETELKRIFQTSVFILFRLIWVT